MVYSANARTSEKRQMEVIRLEDIWRQRLHVLGWSAITLCKQLYNHVMSKFASFCSNDLSPLVDHLQLLDVYVLLQTVQYKTSISAPFWRLCKTFILHALESPTDFQEIKSLVEA